MRALFIAVAALCACTHESKDTSPILTLAQLPAKFLRVNSDGRVVRVQVWYDTRGDFCGTLHAPGATLGGRAMSVESAGLRSYPVDFDGGMSCAFPSFTLAGPAASGTIVVSDGETSMSAEFSTLDPGSATLLTAIDGGLHHGDLVEWKMALPPDGFGSYQVRYNQDLPAGQDETWDAGYSDAGVLSARVAADAVGSGTVTFLWSVAAQVKTFDGGAPPELSVGGITGFEVRIATP